MLRTTLSTFFFGCIDHAANSLSHISAAVRGGELSHAVAPRREGNRYGISCGAQELIYFHHGIRHQCVYVSRLLEEQANAVVLLPQERITLEVFSFMLFYFAACTSASTRKSGRINPNTIDDMAAGRASPKKRSRDAIQTG